MSIIIEFFKNNKSKILYICLFLVYFVITFCFSTYLLPIYNADEVWNYGFSYNISKGMIPYKDFSMLQTPLYFYISSMFIKIFGNYLFSLHIFDSIFIALIMLMLYRKISWKSILLFPFFIIVLVPSYNFLCLFFLFLIIFLIHEKRDNDLLISFIIGLIFMTKQSIGIVMFIPMIYYSKKKIKSILLFLIPFICFSIYFLFNGALLQFIDHSFLGMLDFNQDNKLISVYTYIEFVEVLFMVIILIKNKFRDKVLFYILSFQIMSYPIFEFFHWLIAFIPFYYYLCMDFNFKKINNIYYLIKFIAIVGFYISIIGGSVISLIDFDIKLEKNNNNFFYSRNIYLVDKLNLEEQVGIINKYKDEYDYQFFIMINSYYRKLYMGLEINEYDLLLDGNMGYNGDIRNIKEIDKICSSNSCVFFVEEVNFKYSQLSKKIYDYVTNKYNKIDDNKYFDIYDNVSD